MIAGRKWATWQPHVNHVNAPHPWRHWLTDPGSLTLKLTLRSTQFRVRRLCQERELALHDEFAAVRLPRPLEVQQREVLLLCDGNPVVFAHTVVPLTATSHDWPFFSALGERSLGSTLFGDPRVRRGNMQYARLPRRHPLVLRAQAAAGDAASGALFARRCLYQRRRGLLLVTELFLPGVMALPTPSAQQPNERLIA